MRKIFQDALAESSVIAAIKSDEGLQRCLKSESRIIFILYGDICNISDIVSKIKKSGKIALVHVDLINGLSSREIVVDFIKKYTSADGIITTKPALIKRAKELSLCTVLRIFALDSMAYENIERQVRSAGPDVIEVLPGMMPKIIAHICRQIPTPVIAGGLVSEKRDAMELLNAGAICVSTTNPGLWK
ncbi:MAG: glycerol-3-phosphate responsive antiterminator [Lachnospiraceae bacterium]|nr:glycerol-3-phosphate responsive antiterminator [Lachnospiraceae bacterium]